MTTQLQLINIIIIIIIIIIISSQKSEPPSKMTSQNYDFTPSHKKMICQQKVVAAVQSQTT